MSVVPALARIRWTDDAGSEKEARIAAGRREYRSFQIVVRAPSAGLDRISATASDLVSAEQRRIAASNVTLFLERYVAVLTPSYVGSFRNNRLGAPGAYPDGLVPLAPGKPNPKAIPHVEARRNQPIWVDVFVPPDTAPGTYRGEITVNADQGRAVIPVSLVVWDFELPLKPSLHSSFGVSAQRMHDTRYAHLLLEHRVMPAYADASAAPGLAQRGLNVLGLPFWSGRQGCTMNPAPSSEDIRKSVESYPGELRPYVYVADEIDRWPCVFSTVVGWARNVHAGGGHTLVTVPPRTELMDDGTGRSAVDIWVVLPSQYRPLDDSFAMARRRGDEIWSYTALVSDDYSPKWLIDADPINHRILPGFLSQAMGLNGFLYWKVDYWNEDPWRDVYFRQDSYSWAGEGLLVYPGEPVGVEGPVPSIRLKWIRDGADDYEYVQMLKAIGRGDFALNLVRGIASDWRTWTRDPVQLERVRQQLGEELNRLHGKAP